MILFLLLSFCLSGEVSVVLGPPQTTMLEPFGVDFDPKGNWYVVEHKGERILKITSQGAISVFAGTGEAGRSGDNGPALKAQFFDPHGIAITRDGRFMYVADTRNHQVRRIDMRSGTIITVAGTGEEGFSGDGGEATKATFKGTFGIALSPDDRALYVADLGNKRVRRLDLRSRILTTAAKDLTDPRAVAVDSRHNLYILERSGNALRVLPRGGEMRTAIAPGMVTPGMVKPDLKGPKYICIDREDNVIIADAENHLIRRYDPRDGSTKIIAGTGTKGTTISASDPLQTELNRPHGVFVNRAGQLYIVDSYNHRVIRLTEPRR